MGGIERLLSAARLCELLDTKPRTLRRWVSCGSFPPHDKRVNGSKRWFLSTYENYINGGNGNGNAKVARAR